MPTGSSFNMTELTDETRVQIDRDQDTVEKTVEEKIAELELRVKGILSAIPAGVVFVTTDGIIEATTARFDKLLGLEAKDIVGQGLSQFIATAMSDKELAKRFVQACSEGLVRAEALTQDGRLSVLISSEMIDTAEGVGLMLCMLDATKESAL